MLAPELAALSLKGKYNSGTGSPLPHISAAGRPLSIPNIKLPKDDRLFCVVVVPVDLLRVLLEDV